MGIDRQGFSYVRELVRTNSGVILDVGKEYLVEARLRPLAERVGQRTVQSFIDRLRSTPLGAEHQRVVEAMTTNETSFFRDVLPFESLRTTVLPALIEARSRERGLNIWSAACSTGQEPYTVAMIIREYFPELGQWTCRIWASDLARKVVERARPGIYSQMEINRGMPPKLLVKYFRRERLNWILSEEIRGMIEFFELNLARPWPPMVAMDLIFLRNALIYFDVETKRNILAQVRDVLRPDGYLLLGNSETTLGVDDGFERLADDRGGWHQLCAQEKAR
jgi:chemotaxis protein methyltransferase CheR